MGKDVFDAKFKSCKEVFESFRPSHEDFYLNPKKYDQEPFRIFGNLYYVGDKKVCRHVVDTGSGLILFDVGYGHNLPSLEESIIKLGFSPKDIKYIIISHGHFDHFCGGNELREKYGCKIFLSQVDTQLIKERPERALMCLAPDPSAPICYPDETIEDGEVIELGSTKIRCVAAPGHTFGTMAFFFDVSDGEKTYKAGYFGGVGFLTVYREYCREMGLPGTKSQLMRETAKKLLCEDVDIMIGNHPANNRTLEKYEEMRAHSGRNPFIDKDTWRVFLEELLIRIDEFEEEGY